ncbi:Sec-independent protein translocase protein TatC [Imperialibacter sp. EC-SDR9]|nr:Sec-independent protein translocase protein TatC [Imperialibacter sp. 89]CAD5298002.1 Sec-independent protein translocase protein TatC [Imperialibacter sp. 75]VVT34262.1 Sec-independent protein translocase protein TatC [Imperialibacter sp. EC-SDR9]
MAESEEKEMSFIDHLEELRWHLVRSVASVLVFSVAAFVSKGFIFGVLILGPSKTDFWSYRMLCKLSEVVGIDALCINELPFIIQSRQLTGQFTMHITSSLVVGLICAFPYAFWEIWRFVAPGLYSHERNLTRGATFFVSFLFMIGVLFGYFIVTPVSVYFLANYQLDPSILNEFDIISYVSTVVTLVLSSGLIFQLPIVMYFLTKAGIVTPEFLITYRRHAIVVIFIVGAVITPPDPFSQMLVSLPIVGLYEVSIYISKRIKRREAREEAKEALKRNPKS